MIKRIKTGFSLIEIMICISLFVLTTGLLIANISFLDRYLIRAEIDKIFNTLRYLQNYAIISNKTQVLVFDKVNNKYTYNKKTCKLPTKVKFGFIADAKGPPANPRKKITSPITFKGENITFQPNGIIKSGTIYLTDNKNKYLYAISSGVSQVSYLRKYAYNQKWIQIK